MKLDNHQTLWSRCEGYFLIPHELLHLLGYRLVGKRCRYQWGNRYVTPLGPLSRPERLVGMLFPFVVFVIAFVICTVLSGLAYRQLLRGGPFIWFGFWTAASFVMGLYAGTTVIDLRRAYLLILNKPWYDWTPLDIFFWPVVDWDEVRRKVSDKESNAK